MGFFDKLGSGLVSVVGGLAGGLLDSYSAKKAASLQNEYMYSLMQYQNDYNTPKNQMARLKDAGLNPNLVYGSGGTTTLSASGSAPSVGFGRYNFSKVADLLEMHQREAQIKNMQAQYDNIKAQNASIGAQTKLIKAQTRTARADAMMREKDLQIYQDSGIDPNKRGLMAWLPTVVAKASNGSEEAARLVKNVFNSSEFKAGQRAYREAERRGGPGYGLFSSYQLNY